MRFRFGGEVDSEEEDVLAEEKESESDSRLRLGCKEQLLEGGRGHGLKSGKKDACGSDSSGLKIIGAKEGIVAGSGAEVSRLQCRASRGPSTVT